MEENPLLRLIKEGKIIITPEGKIVGFNEYAVFLPVRVLNRLFILLKKKYGKSDAQTILKEVGGFQVRQALYRYVKTLAWDQLPKDKIIEFVKKITVTLGFGNFEIMKEKESDRYLISIPKTPFAEEFVLEYGKQEEPVDFYLVGCWEVFFTIFTGKPMVCEEVKCYAKGDDCCEFIVKPKEEVKEEK